MAGKSGRDIVYSNTGLSLALFLATSTAVSMPASSEAQGANDAQLEQMLNMVDRPGVQWNQPPPQTRFNQQQSPQGFSRPLLRRPASTQQFNPPYSSGAQPFDSSQMQRKPGLLEMLMGGGGAGPSPGSQVDPGAYGRANSQRNVALNAASSAQAAADRAQYGSKTSRQNAAYEARYQANLAASAASQAESAAANGPDSARSAAADARAAANRAQSAAASAESYAGGW